MITQNIASILGLSIVAILIAVDVWLALDNVPGNTWSEILRDLSKHTLFVPWSLGVLLGHWFHPSNDLCPVLGDASIWVLTGVSAVLTIIGLVFCLSKKYRVPAWPWVLGGTVIGSLLWPVHVVLP